MTFPSLSQTNNRVDEQTLLLAGIVTQDNSLSEPQAIRYMQTQEYNDYLQVYLSNSIYFKDLNGELQPFYWADMHTKEIKLPSEEEIKIFREKLKREKWQKDKITLMTKGIDALPKNCECWQEYKQGSEVNDIIDLVMCLFPFCKNNRPKPFSLPCIKQVEKDQKTGKFAIYHRKKAIINNPLTS